MGVVTSVLLKPFNVYYWYIIQRAPRVIRVQTGDSYGAGTDANVWIKLTDKTKHVSPEIHLDLLFRDDFERGNIDDFPAPKLDDDFGEVDKIELWRDDSGFGSNWYVDKIEILERSPNGDYKTFVFPIHRWIKGGTHYFFSHLDCVLPKNDEYKVQRKLELEVKRAQYQPTQHHPSLPVQVKELPNDEHFSDNYKWDIVKTKISFVVQAKVTDWQSETGNWKSLGDLKQMYGGMLPEPKGATRYTSDVDFGRQRLTGANCIMITLCEEIPEKLAVTEEMLRPFLEGLDIQHAIEAKRLFFIDLKVLEGIPTKENLQLCIPIALFFLNKKQNLMPVAIQLHQDAGPNNPVFLPSDPEYTWLLAKMWYNNADAMYHQSVTHLAYTHLIMESMAVCFHRSVSPSHPIFKLLAPHFLFLLAINTRGLALLLAPGGWVDKTMTIGVEGCIQLIGKGCDQWRMNVHGNVEKEFESRGVLDSSVLPHYYYRDDCVQLYKAINKYVSSIVNIYYDSDDDIIQDEEMQSMVKDLTTEKKDGGMGIKGVPGDGQLKTKEELVEICTCLVFTCSVSHASANFAQYDNYAFPPYYPGCLKGAPPTDKSPKTEEDVVNTLPEKYVTLDIMVVTKLLSMKATRSLGDFEFRYMYDDRCQKAVETLQDDLLAIGDNIDERNAALEEEDQYSLLHPANIPNSISI